MTTQELQERIDRLEQENASLLAIMSKNDKQFKDTVEELAERTCQCEQAEARLSYLRPEVMVFATRMEHALRAHDGDKGPDGWKNDDALALWHHLHSEAKELYHELVLSPVVDANVVSEAIDVANMAMMIADVSGLPCTPVPTPALDALRERVKTLEADNAAMVDLLFRIPDAELGAMEESYLELSAMTSGGGNYAHSCQHMALTAVPRLLGVFRSARREVSDNPHPGSALLERIKRMEEGLKRIASGLSSDMLGTTSMDRDEMMAIAAKALEENT